MLNSFVDGRIVCARQSLNGFSASYSIALTIGKTVLQTMNTHCGY
jgi:hypothetical protein